MTIGKIDSNATGLSFAEEASLRTLPGTPIWYLLEPNTYKDFGGKISTVARKPINPSRQQQKGVVTDLEANGGFSQDFTLANCHRLLQGFFFADIREKKKTNPMNSAATALTSVVGSTKTIAAASGLDGFLAGALVKTSGFAVTANNGLKTVASSASAALVVVETMADEASPPAAASVEVVGFQFPFEDVAIAMNGSLVRLTSIATDLTTLGLIPGEWIWLGGDAATSQFSDNLGWARISVIAATYLEFDKTNWSGVAHAKTGKTIQIFFGSVLKNESDPNLIKRRTYQIERKLGNDANGVMSEYLVGAVANNLTMNIVTADKVTMDLDFIGVDNEQRTGAVGPKAGTRPSIAKTSAFNTSSDVDRFRLSLVDDTNSYVSQLFAFATELKLEIKNNVTANKAIANLGAFDLTAGMFEVSGSMTAYFADITAVQAVRNNSSVSLDLVMTHPGQGIVLDIPLITLGDARLKVEQDHPITLPLTTTAAEGKFGSTLMFNVFQYLPVVAAG